MMRIQLVSPMETVFRPESFAPYTSCSALGEETAFQAVLTGQEACRPVLRTDAPVHAEIFRIGFVPCALAAYPDRHDADYLTTEPGLFPDVLYPLEGDAVQVDGFETLWISLRVDGDAPGGTYAVELEAGGQRAVFRLTVIPAALPAQRLCFTQWFHADCIASLHKVEIYSPAHWALIEKYMRATACHGVNVLLTPVLTPALDTAVGGERPCTQLRHRGAGGALCVRLRPASAVDPPRAGMRHRKI